MGSEMCIRDRGATSPLGGESTQRRGKVSCESGVKRPPSKGNQGGARCPHQSQPQMHVVLSLAAPVAVPITIRPLHGLPSCCNHGKEHSATDSVRLSENRRHSDRIDLRRRELARCAASRVFRMRRASNRPSVGGGRLSQPLPPVCLLVRDTEWFATKKGLPEVGALTIAVSTSGAKPSKRMAW